MAKANISFEDLIELINENPIDGANAAQKRNVGVRNGTYESSISAGALYRKLNASRSLQSAFYALPFWAQNAEGTGKSYTKNPAHLNKHCHQFVYGFRDGSEGKRAEDHASATQAYLDSDKTLEQIFAALKKGGFDSLRKAAPVQKKQTAEITKGVKTEEDPDGVSDTSPTPLTAPGNDGNKEPPTRTNRAAASGGNKLPRMTFAKVFCHLLVSMDADELDQFLPANSSDDDEALIRLVRRTAKNGMAIWRAIEIDFTPAMH